MAIFRQHDNTGKVLFDSSKATFGLIKSAGFEVNGHELDEEVYFTGARNYKGNPLSKDRLGLYSMYRMTKGFRLRVQFIPSEQYPQAKRFGFGFAIANGPNSDKDVLNILNRAVQADVFGDTHYTNDPEVNKQIRDRLKDFADKTALTNGYADLTEYQIKVRADTCPLVFIARDSPLNDSIDNALPPLLALKDVSKKDGEWVFTFRCHVYLFKEELKQHKVYFFDLFSRPVTTVGINTYTPDGVLSFSTAQPPMQAVSVPKPYNITTKNDDWAGRSDGASWWYNKTLDGSHLYAVLASTGVKRDNNYKVVSMGLRGSVIVFLHHRLIYPITNEEAETNRVFINQIPNEKEAVLFYTGGYVVIDVTNMPFPYDV